MQLLKIVILEKLIEWEYGHVRISWDSRSSEKCEITSQVDSPRSSPLCQLAASGIGLHSTDLFSGVTWLGFFNSFLFGLFVFPFMHNHQYFQGCCNFPKSHLFSAVAPQTMLLQRTPGHNVSIFLGPNHVLACREDMFTHLY